MKNDDLKNDDLKEQRFPPTVPLKSNAKETEQGHKETGPSLGHVQVHETENETKEVHEANEKEKFDIPDEIEYNRQYTDVVAENVEKHDTKIESEVCRLVFIILHSFK